MILPFSFQANYDYNDLYEALRHSEAYREYLDDLAYYEATEAALGACVTYAAADRLRKEFVAAAADLADSEATLYDLAKHWVLDRQADDPTEVYEREPCSN
jgi:hypothetical protein